MRTMPVYFVRKNPTFNYKSHHYFNLIFSFIFFFFLLRFALKVKKKSRVGWLIAVNSIALFNRNKLGFVRIARIHQQKHMKQASEICNEAKCRPVCGFRFQWCNIAGRCYCVVSLKQCAIKIYFVCFYTFLYILKITNKKVERNSLFVFIFLFVCIDNNNSKGNWQQSSKHTNLKPVWTSSW